MEHPCFPHWEVLCMSNDCNVETFHDMTCRITFSVANLSHCTMDEWAAAINFIHAVPGPYQASSHCQLKALKCHTYFEQHWHSTVIKWHFTDRYLSTCNMWLWVFYFVPPICHNNALTVLSCMRSQKGWDLLVKYFVWTVTIFFGKYVWIPVIFMMDGIIQRVSDISGCMINVRPLSSGGSLWG